MADAVRQQRAPAGLAVPLGVIVVAIGVVLTTRPFTSLSVLVALVAMALFVTGIADVATARATAMPGVAMAAGVLSIGAAVVTIVWPHITVAALAVVAGLGMVAAGTAKIVNGGRGRAETRIVAVIAGLASIAFGVLALAWPTVTLLVVAVAFGARTVVLGGSLIASALHTREFARGSRPRGWLRRLGSALGAIVALGVALLLLAVSVAIHRAEPGAPGAFYTAPDPLPAGTLGTIIRQEEMPSFDSTSTAYRVLYVSTGYDGKRVAVSGVIYVPHGAVPSGGRKVVDITNGTVGVARNCAPSLMHNQTKTPAYLSGAAAFLRAGWVVTSTDYQGLGTRGPHPYLVGRSEGMNALDIVRAAHNLPAAHAGTAFVVWGHSQGGHAALFTGELAASYAPQLMLLGVAAGAPVPDLRVALEHNIESPVGRILVSFALSSWEQVYGASINGVVNRRAARLIPRIATRCITTANAFVALPDAIFLGSDFITKEPWNVNPWKEIITNNTPGRAPIAAPVLITTGGADEIIPVTTTQDLVTRLCAGAEPVAFHVIPGVGHVTGGTDAVPFVKQWIAGRFADKPAATACPSQ
jgi:uncharacterized membrane protein HdeD (DUF308 family)